MISRHAIAIGICVLLGSFAGEHGVPALLKARSDARHLAAQIEGLRAENTMLRERARVLRTDATAIEAAARHDLGLARKDELVVIVRR